MASKPFPDKRRGTWLLKHRPDPTGPWRTITLGKDPRLLSARPPKIPPQFILDRAHELTEIEYRARHGLAAPQARPRDLIGYIDSYVEAYAASHAGNSLKLLRRHVGNFLAFAAARGITTVQAVTKAVCRDYLELRAKSVNPNTLQTEKGYLSPIWTRAVEDELLQVNPWILVKAPGKRTRPEPTFWTAKQIEAIAKACLRPWQSDLVLVLANTGLRISAALAIEWTWLDWGAGQLRVPAAHSKGGRLYKIAMTPAVHDIFARRLAAPGADRSPLVFPHSRKGGVVSADSARDMIARAIRRAGVPKGHPHDLRHSCGRLMERAGIPRSIIQRQLGHASASMTDRYISATEDETTQFIGRFGVGGESNGKAKE